MYSSQKSSGTKNGKLKGEPKKTYQSFFTITRSNFTQILKWTFLNSSSSWLLKNVRDHWIWAKFDGDMAKIKKSYETVKIWKIHWKLKYSESRYCFANISATEARIFMKFYVVVNFLFCELKFKISWRSMYKCSHSRYNVHARVYNLYTIILSSNSRRTEIEEMTIRWTEA